MTNFEWMHDMSQFSGNGKLEARHLETVSDDFISENLSEFIIQWYNVYWIYFNHKKSLGHFLLRIHNWLLFVACRYDWVTHISDNQSFAVSTSQKLENERYISKQETYAGFRGPLSAWSDRLRLSFFSLRSEICRKCATFCFWLLQNWH